MKNFQEVVVQTEVVDLGVEAMEEDKHLKRDVKMKTKGMQADLDASVNQIQQTLAAKLKDRVAAMKKSNRKDNSIQTNLEGQSLDNAARERQEALDKQQKLLEKKNKLKEAIAKEQKLKEEREEERRQKSKLNKKNLMANKKKMRELKDRLKEQNEAQIKQTQDVNQQIEDMHEKQKEEEEKLQMEGELEVQIAQEEVQQLAKEAQAKLEQNNATDSDDDPNKLKYDEDGNPVVNKKKKKKTHRGKDNYDMNV